MTDKLAIYIHWPWCRKKCPYCDFNSHVAAQIPEEDYIDCLLKDITWHREQTGPRDVVSIFFGGGTPSLMRPQSTEKILAHINKTYGLSDNIEITLEANPTSSSDEKFKNFVAAGINRFSIGVQNLDDEQLQFLGREHSVAEALETVASAMRHSHNVNLDIIYGLPHENFENWVQHVTRVLSFGSQHISAYQLTIEPNTVFHKEVKNKQWSPLTTDAQDDYFSFCCETFVTYDYVNYEISNHAKEGFACKHNLHVWNYGDYIGIGAGAHGRWKDVHNNYKATRAYKMPAAYMEAILSDKGNALYELTPLNELTRTQEHLLMSLRLKNGVDATTRDHAIHLGAIDTHQLQLMEAGKFVHNNAAGLRLTPTGWHLLDAVSERIIAF